MPADLDNHTVIQEHDWKAFRGLTGMENHWQRPGWTPGRRSYHWLIVFLKASALQRLVSQCQARLEWSSLDPVPLDSLHITMGRVAFTDDMTREAAHSIAATAEQLCRTLAPFNLTVGPLTASRGAVRFSVSPWTPLLELHGVLTEATRGVYGEQTTMDTATFRPHLSIAYANGDVPMPALVPTIEALREMPVTTVNVTSVALAEMRREEQAYRYEEIARIALRT